VAVGIVFRDDVGHDSAKQVATTCNKLGRWWTTQDTYKARTGMKHATIAIILILVITALAAPVAHAQRAPETTARVAVQRKAMQALGAIDGVWRGTTTEYRQGGKSLVRGYTEHITSTLDGTLKLLEGRKQDVEGADRFHVFCVLSHDPETGRYTLRAYWPFGEIGDAPFTVNPDGFGWRIELPDGKRIVATGTIKGGVWHEKIEFVAPGQPPQLMEERVLKRVGD
jgi:hypothetical protein